MLETRNLRLNAIEEELTHNEGRAPRISCAAESNLSAELTTTSKSPR